MQHLSRETGECRSERTSLYISEHLCKNEEKGGARGTDGIVSGKQMSGRLFLRREKSAKANKHSLY